MMEDAGDVKFSVGFVETKAKLKVDINEAWRAMMEEKKGGTSFKTLYMFMPVVDCTKIISLSMVIKRNIYLK